VRTVTLVLVTNDGEPMGRLPPFTVETPWWQDIEPIVIHRPDVTILRLLDADGTAQTMGGAVTYLAESTTRPPDIEPYAHDAIDHPLRMPWARPGGPQTDLDWAARHVEIAGTPTQVRTWNLSAIWRIPTPNGDAWLKSLPPFFAHEATVINRLGPSDKLPTVIAADGHHILFEEMPGRDGYGAEGDDRRAIIDALVELQRRAPDLTNQVPDWSSTRLKAELAGLLARRGDERPGLRRLLDGWDDRFDAISACGIHDTLFHGDAHPGNARIDTKPPIIFDWGDSGWGHPFFDLVHAHDAETESYWLGLWNDVGDARRAWRLLKPVAVVRSALVFQRFLDSIEPSERVYHRDDVAPYLDEAHQLALDE
jgi:hypothetical protein